MENLFYMTKFVFIRQFKKYLRDKVIVYMSDKHFFLHDRNNVYVSGLNFA